jgi:DNA sulfur modification protein DndE
MITPPVETIRLGPATKTRLTTLKRRTGIENWNVISRWAFCLSIADPAPVGMHHVDSGSAIEMTWKTFAGDQEAIYALLLQHRAENDGDPSGSTPLSELARCHISRGVARLTAQRDIESLSDLLEIAIKITQKTT